MDKRRPPKDTKGANRPTIRRRRPSAPTASNRRPGVQPVKKGPKKVIRRRIVKRKRRRIRPFRLLIFLTAVFLIFFGCYKLCTFAYGLATDACQSANAAYEAYQKRAIQTPPAPKKPQIPVEYKEITNILFIGINKFNAENNSAPYAASLVLVCFNRDTGAATFISIPRNTVIAVDNRQIPINIFQQDGTKDTLAYVSKLFGIPIKEYVIMDEDTAAKLINAFGGINLYIGENMSNPASKINLIEGYQHLNAQQVMQYLRYKNDDLGDIGRVYRQQKFMRAFFDEALSINTIPHLPEIIGIMHDELRSNTAIFSLINLYHFGKFLNANTLHFEILPGRLSYDGKYWLPDYAAINSRLQQIGTLPANDTKNKT